MSKYSNIYDVSEWSEEAFIKYKEVKEWLFKVLAEKWKGKIDDKVYKALIEFKIDITD